MRRHLLFATIALAPLLIAATDAGKPRYGSWGVAIEDMDRSVKPGDDFYEYANGTWAKTTAIPADKSNYGAFDVLQDLSRTRTRSILEAAKADPNSKIGIAYATYLDTAAIDAKGLAPIKPWLDKIKAADNKAAYVALLGQAAHDGVRGPFGAYVGQDDKDPDNYAVSVVQSGLGMPDRDYYLSNDPKLVQTKAAYQAHVAKMLSLAGEANAEARAKAIVDFETQIAEVSWTRIDSRDATKTYNKMAVAQLQQQAPGFDFAQFELAAPGWEPSPTI